MKTLLQERTEIACVRPTNVLLHSTLTANPTDTTPPENVDICRRITYIIPATILFRCETFDSEINHVNTSDKCETKPITNMQNHTSKDTHANNNQLYLRRDHIIIDNTITNYHAENDNYKQHTRAPHRPHKRTYIRMHIIIILIIM